MKHLTSIRAARYFRKAGRAGVIELATSEKDPAAVTLLKSVIPALTMANTSLIANDSQAIELSTNLLGESVVGIILSRALEMPFNVKANVIKGCDADWTQEGQKIRVKAGSAHGKILYPYKLGTLIIVDEELDNMASPGTDKAIYSMLKSAAVQKMDFTFLSDAAEVKEQSPAGALKDAVIASSYKELFKTHAVNGNNLKSSFLVMPVDTLLETSGDFLKVVEKTGVTLLSSQYAKGVSLIDAGNMMINIGGTVIDSSTYGTIDMDDELSGVSTVSLFQAGALAYRAKTFCDWMPLAGTKPVTVLQA
ncbi:hypothetical protein EWJ91_20635 [Salmonella enterica subsp. enterica serovar Ouagadougou]|uniref:Phage major capsid protein n=2 Tax=Salmonella enterica TaxID=28901 RepID=A0A5I0D374_SALET|nr:hypothetical protein [Salmonella enterica subsp. enterica serovar Ouagadougou]MLA11799.1 hypothetical protein [Salmonella enterica subsp. enterica]EBR9513799.1 hypothetical protein [Salmonella enterica subsp. enterica serovar Ouagadougou]EBV0637245.1 hypothetical protein [Salmonella enterica subsp. enterica serovar Ouagadougou]EBV0756048.1 hypothetical protein [Salmonella enterica subsp. enterica serovar Ouagadougou]